jgi:transcriptional regulator with XRE-family HTH domain
MRVRQPGYFAAKKAESFSIRRRVARNDSTPYERNPGTVPRGRQAEAVATPALLSNLERGRLFPTLAPLSRIAPVFGVGLDHFFSDEKESALSRWCEK